MTPWKFALQLTLGFGLTSLFFLMMGPFLVPIFLGGVMAIICYPLHQKLSGKVPTYLSALIVTVGLSLGLLLPFVAALYSTAWQIWQRISQIKIPKGNDMSFDSIFGMSWVKTGLSKAMRYMPVDRAWVEERLQSGMQLALEKFTVLVTKFLSTTPALVLATTVVIISMYFFLVDGRRFLKFLLNISPLTPEKSQKLFTTLEVTCRGVVVGLILSSLTQAAIMTTLFIITGIDGPLFFGMITFICGMIPVVGSSPVWIGGTLYLVLSHHPGLAIVMLIGGILTGLSDNVVRPWVMSGKNVLHPFLALVSVFGAVNIFGPTGIFLGPIIAAVFVSFLNILALEINVK